MGNWTERNGKFWRCESGSSREGDQVVLQYSGWVFQFVWATHYCSLVCLNNLNFNEAYNFSRVVDSNSLDASKQENNVVGYHIIRVPRHFKKIFDKKCFRYIGLRCNFFDLYDCNMKVDFQIPSFWVIAAKTCDHLTTNFWSTWKSNKICMRTGKTRVPRHRIELREDRGSSTTWKNT